MSKMQLRTCEDQNLSASKKSRTHTVSISYVRLNEGRTAVRWDSRVGVRVFL